MAQELAELAVGEAELQQVALVERLDLRGVVVGLVRQARDRIAAALVQLRVGQELPRRMGHEGVLEAQLRPDARRYRPDPVVEAPLAGRSEVGLHVRAVRDARSSGEVAPVVGHRRQLRLEPRRGDHVQPDEAEVRGHRLHALAVGLGETRVLAQPARAQRGGLLGDVHPVRLAEQREQAGGMVGGDRQLARGRVVAVHDRRLRVLGRVVHRVGVAEPCRGPLELGEGRVADRVHVPAIVHERAQRELVEEHHHDRGPHRACDRPSARFWLGKASPDTGAVKRNRARNRTGAAERTFMNHSTTATRA